MAYLEARHSGDVSVGQGVFFDGWPEKQNQLLPYCRAWLSTLRDLICFARFTLNIHSSCWPLRL